MLKIILLQDWAIESILSVEDTLKKLDFDFMLFFTQHRDVLFLNYFRWQFFFQLWATNCLKCKINFYCNFPNFWTRKKWCKIYINRDIFLLFFLPMHALHCNVSANDILPFYVEITSFQLIWQIYYFFNVCRGTISSTCVHIKFPQSVRTYFFINTGT